MNLRFAEGSDAESLRRIYAQYVETPAIFEYVLSAEMTGNILDKYQALLAHYKAGRQIICG